MSEVGSEANKILSDIIVHMKYAKYIPELQRRENWEEICTRNMNMHIKKYPILKESITNTYKNFVFTKKVLPSMRSAQFAGKPIEVNQSRIYNCCFCPIDDLKAFNEIMFLLLGGTGVGYSVQNHHIEKLPEIIKPNSKKTKRYLIPDSIEGWADAIKILMKSYTTSNITIRFDYSDIRAKGERLITAGGKAPGPQPLKDCIHNIRKILDAKENYSNLSPLEAHDIICFIADSVLAGGIRRSALISLFSVNDEEMISCKAGAWWELNPQRGRANNSAVLLRNKLDKNTFLDIWKKIEASGSGEPGIMLSNDKDWGTNPCCFVGNTKILTHSGYKNIKDCDGDELFINKNGEVVNGITWSNGVKDIIELNLSNKTKIKCTPEHRFMDNEGYEEEAQYLHGLRLMPYYKMNNEVSEFTKYGFIQGDGALTKLDSTTHKGLEINIGIDDGDIFELFGIEKDNDKRTYYTNGFNEVLKGLQFHAAQLPERPFPNTYLLWNKEDKLMFLKGMYSANGSIIKGQRIAYKTTCKQLVDELTTTLTSFEISSYITTNKEKEVHFSNGTYTCKESYDINISRYDSVIKFAELIGFVHKYKQISLEELILSKAPKVLNIKKARQEEVFDFSLEDDTHWGVVEGVIAHNCEIALRPFQMCNLVEINATDIDTQQEFNDRAAAGAFIGTLQAGYTDFHYLRSIWKKTTEKDALLGVSMTGIASNKIFDLNIEEAVNQVKETNEFIADLIGINKSARLTCVKPAGTTSLVLGSSSGIHAWHNDYYIRRVRVGKNEAIYTYLSINAPELLEDDLFRPNETAIISIPQKAPINSTTRHENALDLLERIKKVSMEWVKPGHISGQNTHNVSATVSIKDNEWQSVGNWMWDNKKYYAGLSVLPYDNGSYQQAPFEDCTKEEYESKMKLLKSLDLNNVIEVQDDTNLSSELACAGPDGCEIV